MAAIELRNVEKRWGDTVAVRDVSLCVEDGSFVVLLGPSGCGKSTTLRMIAGLETVSEGRIFIENEDITDTTPAERRLSMVFQSYALFPHLNVEQNILFGLNVRRVEKTEQADRLRRVADIVGLTELLERKPAQLSGGQRQRVALARAIIAENRICLMDEPLSNLDAKLRQDMRIEIRDLQRRLAMTVVYVTHDQAEAMSMADQVVLLNAGSIVQTGPPSTLYDRPATTFAAGFIGTPPMNLLTLINGEGGAVIPGRPDFPVLDGQGAETILGIRPEHVVLSAGGGIPAELMATDYQGADTIITARIGEQKLLARVAGRFEIGDQREVFLSWLPENLHAFDAATGKRNDDFRPYAIGNAVERQRHARA